MAEERNELSTTDTKELIHQIRASIETLLSLRASDRDYDNEKYVSKLTIDDFPCDAKSLLTHQSNLSKKCSPPKVKTTKQQMDSVTSLNTVQNLEALETQIQRYEQDIRKHISVEHQLQLYAEDLKATIKDQEKDFKLQIKRLESKYDKALKDKSEMFGTLKIKE